ncbi:MAG: hypothetical protein QM756_23735 [Polyangiaceae bacterium]
MKEWLADPARMALLASTARPDVYPEAFDAIYFTGGHAVMWDFPGSEGLQHITRTIHERGGIVSPNLALRDGKPRGICKDGCWKEETYDRRSPTGIAELVRD